jgi:aspartate carbamoyltransferase catalytic subunit
MALRLQKERMEAGLVNLEDYIARYQITERRLGLAKPQAPLLHPGP